MVLLLSLPHIGTVAALDAGRRADNKHVNGVAATAAGGLASIARAPYSRLSQCQRSRRADMVVSIVVSAARRGSAGEQIHDAPPAEAAEETSTSERPGGKRPTLEQQNQKPRQTATQRRQFGPEPPPSQPQTTGASVLEPPASSSSSQRTPASDEDAPPAPKRRGRPPKQKGVTSAGEQQQAPPSSAPPPQSAATAAASRSKRKPFGPEPPPAPSISNDARDIQFPVLPEDPSQLDMDYILDLPLPDPRVGEPFRLSDDFGELGMGEGEEGNDEDDDGDLDYDQLIALAGRVDAASYVERAFERAKRGLDPTPDPLDPAPDPLDPTPDPLGGPPGDELGAVAAEATTPPQQGRADAASSPKPSRQTAQAAVSSSGLGTDRAVGARRPSAAATAATAATTTRPSAATPSGGGHAAGPSSPPSSGVYVDTDTDGGEGDALSPAEEDAGRRRVELLVELLAASGGELEAKLDAAAPHVDEPLLALLERRYASALALRQDAATTECIATLFRTLKYMYERRTSSASERLLDDVLEILGDSALQPDPERRRQEAAARLRNAFTGGMLDVDVFTAAAALAERRQAAAEELAGEQVALEAFKADTMALLGHAKGVQLETSSSLEAIEEEAERLRREEPAVLEGREWRARLEQVRLARQALAEREGGIDALEEVLLLTRAIEMQLMTGKMGAR